MNQIERYKLAKQKLNLLEIFIRDKLYTGAGLSVGITAGTKHIDYEHQIEFQISNTDPISEILEGIKSGLEASLKFQKSEIDKYRKEMSAFIDELEEEK